MSRKLLTTMALLGLALILLPATASAQFACFPSCDATDARFLSLAGSGLATFDGADLNFVFSVPPSQPVFMFGIFDGENGADWDSSGVAGLNYTLYADPTGTGTGTVVLGSWTALDFLDNAWRDFTFAHSPAALAPSGNHFYRLQIELVGAAPLAWSNFKVRTQDSNGLQLQPQAFSFSGFLFTGNDLATVYPAFPSLTPTSYDGTWEFFVRVEESATSLSFWDGDLDYGQADCNLAFQDTDDPDTPGAPFLPAWAAPTNVPEGVAVGLVKGCGQVTGDPADDATDFAPFQRSPSVVYTVFTPTGFAATNSNPSGNLEWEAFTLSTGGGGDATAPSLPAGTYRVVMGGMDLSNFNSWRLPGAVVGMCQDGSDCTPRLNPYMVGDTVFFDANGNGVQDPGEPGIENVVVNLIDGGGQMKESTSTGANGLYFFQVRPGTFTVEIDASNFGPGGALEGLASTTGGESIADTVVDDNVLTYDFGYSGNSSIGDFVWYDANANGLQDDGPSSGLGGVTVNLTEAGDDGIFGTPDDVSFSPMVTAGDGSYDFTGLLPGLYRVDVSEATLPAGVSLTTGNEPLTVNLGFNEDYNDADFGYTGTGSIGDRVWLDEDGDGVQDAGEDGIAGVTVNLRDPNSGAVIATTVTGSNGLYLFSNLPAGAYTVQVDTSTLPPGAQPTFDVDGLGTPNEATVSLAAGQDRTDVDFGYATECGVCDGKLNYLSLQYLASTGAHIKVVQKKDGKVVFDDFVAAGASFSFHGKDKKNTFSTEIRIFADGVEVQRIHTSCSLPVDPGMIFGDFLVLAGASRNGGALCGVAPPPGGGGGGNACLPALDFEIDGQGNPLHKGQIIDNEFAALGITVTTNSPGNHPAMIFDSSSPTGGDWDLGTPNQAFGGPGVGSGGGPGAGANHQALGKILIISEDGDSNDPDDNARGGTLIFTFATTVRLTSVDILDIDHTEAMGQVRAYDGSGALVAAAAMQMRGNNSFQTVEIAASDVARLEIEFPKSGAVGGIVFCADETVCVDKAEADPAYGGSSGGHALYLPGFGSGRFIFDPVGDFTQNANGTASITGTIYDRNNPSLGFMVNAELSGATSAAPAGSPKKELGAAAYSANGGPVDPSTWTYYTGITGSLLGVGGYAGAVVSFTRVGPAFQIGVGANGKNIHDGASSWFTWVVNHQPSSGGSLPANGQGDFNLDLVSCDSTPPPIS